MSRRQWHFFPGYSIFFIPSNELGRNLHVLSLVHSSKLLGNPLCADFPVSHIIMQYGICGSIADIQMCSHFRHCYLSVFSNRGICPVDVDLRAQCWWPTRTAFISNTCSTQFKPFHPLINLLLTHGALSILSQHTTVNFHRFTPAQRNHTTPRCSSMVQSCKGASMFSRSLLPLDWRQSTVLQMAELFNRHCQYCTMHQLLSVPVTT